MTTKRVKSFICFALASLLVAVSNLSAAIIFVDSTASGANNGTSWTDAYTSLNTALLAANIAPGDQVLVSGTFNETVTVAELSTRPTPNVIQGDDKSGGAGAGNFALFTIDGQSTRTNCITTALTSDLAYVFLYMRCTGATGIGADFTVDADSITFKNCQFDNNGSDGVVTGLNVHWVECDASSNTGNGIKGGGDNWIVGCKVHSNGGHGVDIVYGGVLNSEFFSNNTAAIHFNATLVSVASGNTIDGDGKDTTIGIHQDHTGSDTFIVTNNIIYDCVTGIDMDGGIGARLVSRNNLLNSNTANYAGTGVTTFTGEVTGAPSFKDESANDYRLKLDSPARGAGFDSGVTVNGVSHRDIGAHQRKKPVISTIG